MSKEITTIPIKNIFYMLCYAWNILAIKNDIKVRNDDFCDAYNLLARIFTYALVKLIRSGFHKSYIENIGCLSTLQGKINIQQTISSGVLQRKSLICCYDNFSKDDVFNQVLKYTIKNIINNKSINSKTKKELRKLLLYFSNIREVAPTSQVRRQFVFNRNNLNYKVLIQVAIMLYDNTIVNEELGKNAFKDFFRDGQMEKVYEKFILNFYAINLDSKKYRVHSPKINWTLENDSKSRFSDIVDVVENPADRRTDIVIENKIDHKQLIIDAKYYANIFVLGYYDDTIERYRTRHIEQIRGYVTDSKFEGKKIGALVYPAVDFVFDRPQLIPIQNSMVIFKTLNLNQDWKKIETDLLDFINISEQLVDR